MTLLNKQFVTVSYHVALFFGFLDKVFER